MAQKWTFHDPAGALADYSFYVNPNQDSPQYQKSLQFHAVTIPGNAPLLFEGQDEPTVFSVQGDILSEGQYTSMLQWYNLRHQFLLTDDNGNQRYIYLTEFSPVRKRSALYPWRYTYTLSGYVISETFPSMQYPNAPGSNAPSVSSISPTRGTVNGGTAITITGTNFLGAQNVLIGGVPCTFTVTSSTSITTTSPSGTAGNSVHVQVVNGGLYSLPTTNDLFTWASVPSVTSVSPASGPDTGGQSVVITGSQFTGATSVTFGSTAAASFTVNSDTQITAVTPAASDGTVAVTVVTPVGSGSLSNAYTFSAPGPPSMMLMATPQEA